MHRGVVQRATGDATRTLTYSQLRRSSPKVRDEVEDGREEDILLRRGHENLALLPAHELRSLKEIAHLLCSSANASRLLDCS